MALSQHDLLRLMESLRTADGIELIRVLAQRILRELIEAEATAHIGAEPGEHTETRTTWRNGHRERGLTTQAGDLDLTIPKVRTGSFFPSLLERRRRIDQALYAVIVEAYVHRVSTRSVDDLVRALGADTGISKSEVSRLCAGLDTELSAFRTRPLDHTRFPYIYLGGHVLQGPGEPPDCLPGCGHRHRRHRGRRTRSPRADGRRQRDRGVLERVPALPARTGPERGPPGHRRPPLGAGQGRPQGRARRRLPKVPRPLDP